MRDVVKGIRTVAANHIESGNFHDFLQMHNLSYSTIDNNPTTTDLFQVESYEYPYDEFDYDDGALQQGNGKGDAA